MRKECDIILKITKNICKHKPSFGKISSESIQIEVVFLLYTPLHRAISVTLLANKEQYRGTKVFQVTIIDNFGQCTVDFKLNVLTDKDLDICKQECITEVMEK